ncbi:MAG: LPS export ABC transporter periplasmic protein LptC [Chitinophagales bacterium]|jgi:LPS export ABC transporter protein LptC|nr:LPS export ABC transporter periplasmic protein LptC [Sphingobacteriales bacterium]
MRTCILSTIILFLLSCKNDLQNTQMEKDSLAARTDVGKNIVVNYSEKGIRTAILTAPTMVKQEDTAFKTYFPDGIMLKLYDSMGNISSTMTSNYGEHDHKTNQMKARDSVKVVSADGRILKSQELIWIENERKMQSFGQVEIRNKNEIIYGDTLFADENLKRYVVKKIRGIVNVTK